MQARWDRAARTRPSEFWWPQRAAVEEHYGSSDYAGPIADVASKRGATLFRHELVCTSLVIRNFVTGRDEQLAPTAQGYDHRKHVESLIRLIKTLNDLREWESDK
jgi:hypothetical protein